MTAYAALTDYGAEGAYSNPEFILVGDYVTSPSHVYYGVLTNSQFVISRGSSPSISGNNPVWSVPTNFQAGQVNVADFTAGQFGITSIYNTDLYHTPTAGLGKYNTFAWVNDNGAFNINYGTLGSPGQAIFSNNVNDPVTSIKVPSINYDLNAAMITTSPVGGDSVSGPCRNSTSSTITCHPKLSLSYTKSQTWDWNLSQSLTLGVSSTTTIGVPDIASEAIQLQLSATTTLSGGESNTSSTTKTYETTVDVPTPPGYDYLASITAKEASYQVPYTYKGIATYRSGATATVDGSGIFVGSDATLFDVAVKCTSYRGGTCPNNGGETIEIGTPVSEPASLLILSVALLIVMSMRLFPVSAFLLIIISKCFHQKLA